MSKETISQYTNSYKGYVFVNKALSSIQKGVQGSHALIELYNKYIKLDGPELEILTDWSKNYKTLIFLDCGFNNEIKNNYSEFKKFCKLFDLPHAIFREDKETMNRMYTAFAGIIPSFIFDFEYTHKEYEYSYPIETMSNALELNFYNFLTEFDLAL